MKKINKEQSKKVNAGRTLEIPQKGVMEDPMFTDDSDELKGRIIGREGRN